MRRFRSFCAIDSLDGRRQERIGARTAGSSLFALFLLVAFLTSAYADESELRPGQYVWHPEIAPDGPLVVVISLDEQRAYVYRNGVAIGYSTISSGRHGHETPAGVFTILQKDRDHRSNKYDDAPMPYMERLTWDGVAMHGGTLPGYPASHGCVRLPRNFAERLFAITRRGDTVVTASGSVSPITVVHPSVLAPVTPRGIPVDLGEQDVAYSWDEHAAAPGPVSLVVSVPDRRVHVFRNGIRIGTARLKVAEGFAFHGAVVFVRLREVKAGSSVPAAVPGKPWATFRVRGVAGKTWTMDELAAGLKVPDEFAHLLEASLAPGTSILVIDSPATGATNATGPSTQTVLESESPRNGKLDGWQ